MKIGAKAGSRVYELNVDRQNGNYVVEVDGERHIVDAQKLEANFYSILTDGRSYEVSIEADGDSYFVRHGAAGQRVTLSDPSRRARDKQQAADGPLKVISIMPGKVVRLLVAEGDTVEEGQGIAVVEAMKMENEITAERAGKIRSLDVEPGQAIEGGGLLMVIE